jgi:hypothetical protein
VELWFGKLLVYQEVNAVTFQKHRTTMQME